MKHVKAGVASLSLLLAACSTHPSDHSAQAPAAPSLDDMRAVSPTLAHNTESMLLQEVWKRPGLSPRDRSLVTLAVLISRQQTVELAYHLNLALDNGVKAGEISEAINHLAFYTGWGNATATILVTEQVFTQRGVTLDQLPPVSPALLPVDEASEKARATFVDKNSRSGVVRCGALHQRCALPRLMATAGAQSTGSQPHNSQRSDRHRAGRAARRPPQQSHGQRADSGRSLRGADAIGVLRRLAERVHRSTGGQRCICWPQESLGSEVAFDRVVIGGTTELSPTRLTPHIRPWA